MELIIGKYEITLQPDATMDQCIEWFLEKYNPAAEKAYPGVKVFTLMGEGEDKNYISTLGYFESKEMMDKYFPTDSKRPNEEAAIEILYPINEETKEFLLNIEHESITLVVL